MIIAQKIRRAYTVLPFCRVSGGFKGLCLNTVLISILISK
ncbi:Hypothetical protein NGK_0180 [Neisseria gonorrhoeae NCCP11945]|uniref:Uncharacterized protein n=1 Tax=Neisseria gonorrhoeae (strain NCCP11945) TaxID=521006 RepID=B4RQ66_NEIG2|nr:Hypothetical protein NGK_0180 [Neisseria gonorrhoeae NCCP11945]EFH21983.1 hypothetical protein NEIPOLOT_02303 [Neisseria polysaccharea ATCC 43768]